MFHSNLEIIQINIFYFGTVGQVGKKFASLKNLIQRKWAFEVWKLMRSVYRKRKNELF